MATRTFDSRVVLFICVSFVQGIGTTGKGWNTDNRLNDLLFRYGYRGIPVHNFAERFICKGDMRQFYLTLKTKFCGLKDLYVYRFLLKLCKDQDLNQRSSALDFLVSAFFDIDRDGKITHYEKLRFEKFGG